MIDLNFWQKKEKFLILEVFKDRTTAFLLSLDLEKNLVLEKTWDNFSWSKTSARFRRSLEKWKVIISAHSSLALTTILPIQLERDPDLIKHPLSNVELENILAQTIARVFTQCRGEASRELNIEELDTVLIENRVVNFKVDNHHVLNPIDFKAKKISAVLEMILTTRDIFYDWKNFFSIGETRNFFFTESAKAELFAIKKIKSPPFHLLVLNPAAPSELFKIEKSTLGESIRRHKINWGLDVIFNSIESSFGISPKAAKKLYSLYLKEETSEKISKHFTLILKTAFQSIFTSLDRAKTTGPVYIDTPLELPPFFPKKRQSMSFNSLPTGELIEKLGFKIDLSAFPWPENQCLKRLAPFFEFYYNKDDLEINYWLRRRLHWLGSMK